MIGDWHPHRGGTIVVIGNGMVGHRFCEQLVQHDVDRRYRVVTFCEEPRAAYDRVGLTSFFAHRDAEKLMLANQQWYLDHGVELHIGDRAARIDRRAKVVYSDRGVQVPFDAVVLATGSYPFVPPVPGVQNRGVFVYRTIADLEQLLAFAPQARRAAVIGGGLLGLEAAKAAHDLALETHVIEFAPRLMPRQIDDVGSRILVQKIEQLGVHVHLNKATKEVLGQGGVTGIRFTDGSQLDVEMVIVSAGIRPRDELARECGLAVGERGGVIVNDHLQTSDPCIFAVGEVAAHAGMCYGLVAPGYTMAEVVARNFVEPGSASFRGADMSTKLKLMGIDVASFGDYEAPAERARALTYEDPLGGVYKKLLFSPDGKRLLGGVLVGDATEYANLLMLSKSAEPLACAPGELLLGTRTSSVAVTFNDNTQICSCNNVAHGALVQAIRDQGLTTLADVKRCTRAGTGCGGCLPLVTGVLNAELAATGKQVNQHLCEHFAFSRQELFEIVKIRQLKTFAALLETHGRGDGCEICKPAVASILASLWNEPILEPPHRTLQDTNDRFLANIQRGGLYSVVPRVPGGEILPEQLIALGQIAKKFGLYTKITGGQRIDLFGAQVQQLPDIWEEVVAAGMESGHAYGKALRTVKSCVGSTWCRYGVQDSVGLAIRIERRYRGLRAPHKIKAAVSGCMRECAEAQSKDFGLIATEQGYNLYVCGNGGAKPRHADLLAANLDESTAIRYIDRFLMYYIETADRLTRTSVWLEALPGGIDRLREIVVDDKLRIADELERRMQHLVDTYRCEWTDVVNDPARRRQFKQFVNSDDTETGIEIVTERGQSRPADWPKDRELVQIAPVSNERPANEPATRSRPPGGDQALPQWVRVGAVDDFPLDGGAAVKYGDVQIAVFRYRQGERWYACQNMCPHKRAFVLSRGIIGSQGDTPKIACPLHKRTFSLETGDCLTGDEYALKVFPVRVQAGQVELRLPPEDQLNALLAPHWHRMGTCAGSCDETSSARAGLAVLEKDGHALPSWAEEAQEAEQPDRETISAPLGSAG